MAENNTEAKNSKAKIAANSRYSENNYDRAYFYVKKGGKNTLAEFAKMQGTTINAYIRTAVLNQLIQDNANPELIEAVKLKTD